MTRSVIATPTTYGDVGQVARSYFLEIRADLLYNKESMFCAGVVSG